MPIYSLIGEELGKLFDLEFKNFIAIRLFGDRGLEFPITSVSACVDAVLMRKEQPYPIGQRIPAPMLSLIEGKNGVVTKPILKKVLQKGKLITFTLSLPPFSIVE